MTLIGARQLETLVAEAFRRAGVPDEPAGWAAQALLAAELAGVTDHGVRLVLTYVEQLASGAIAADSPRPVLERDPPVLRLDGGNGLGPAVGWWAIDQAVDVASTCGACVAASARANHLGALGSYVARAADQGMAAMLTQATPPVMAPFGGLDAVLGKGSLAIAIPGRGDDHLVLDMSCAAAAKAKIAVAAAEGRSIPPGWALSDSGWPTTNPTEAMEGAQLRWGHKGAALAVLLAAQAGIVGGGRPVFPLDAQRHHDVNRGVFIVVVDSGPFVVPRDYDGALHQLKRGIITLRPSDPDWQVRFPGQRAAASRRERERFGVPVAADVRATLERLAGAV
jgi:LDH2 family malate/lactate/ureidoglycolate dehydrogenase